MELTTAASGLLENKMTRQARLRLRRGRGGACTRVGLSWWALCAGAGWELRDNRWTEARLCQRPFWPRSPFSEKTMCWVEKTCSSSLKIVFMNTRNEEKWGKRVQSSVCPDCNRLNWKITPSASSSPKLGIVWIWAFVLRHFKTS